MESHQLSAECQTTGQTRKTEGCTSPGSQRHLLRVGGVCYLNARPLLACLPEVCSEVVVDYDVPSGLAAKLSRGDLDIAIVPAIEAFRSPDYVVVSDACIAANDVARSVVIFSHVPIERITSIALDAGSRTSATIARILLKECYSLTPQICEFPLNCDARDMATDAVLMIGDRAMTFTQIEDYPYRLDIGRGWREWTGYPLVFALWVARRQVPNLSRWAAVFGQARDLGVARVPALAEIASRELPLSYNQCYEYLSQNLHFKLGPAEHESLRLVRDYSIRNGLFPEGASIRFFDQANPG